MNVADLLADLSSAKKPSRSFDEQIAVLAGYRRVTKTTGTNDGNVREMVYWESPLTKKEERLPYFTASIEHAYQLSQVIIPTKAAAIAWVGERGKAHIEDGEACEAVNPAMALCIAALKTRFPSI